MSSERINEILAGLPGVALPGPDDYTEHFTNEHGEEIVFIQRKGELTATVYHSDVDWDPYEVRKGRCPDMILDAPEREWIAACWQASAPSRPDGSPDLGPDLSLQRVLEIMNGDDEQAAKTLALEAMAAGEVDTLAMIGIPGSERSTCRHCGRRILKGIPPNPSAWTHAEGVVRGCRQSSKERTGTVDEKLMVSWKATPVPEK